MQLFFNTLNYCRKNERNLFFCFLFFHIFVSIFLFIVANTEHLSSLHNGMGIWYFALDSGKYHLEALNLITHLQSHEWSEWWALYPEHHHVKIISLTYLITGYHVPISFEIVNSFVWATSILLIHRVSKLLFINNNLTSLVAIMFFFQPSILISSTQLLRDPILILGFCFVLYGFAVLSKQKTTWKWAVMIQIGIILLLLMREYLSVVVLACLLIPAIALIKEKRFIPPLLFLIIPMLLLVFFAPHKYVPDVDSITDTIEKQVQTPVTNEIQVQTPVTNEIQVQTPVTNEIQVQIPVTNEIQVQTPVTNEIQVQTPVTNEIQVQTPVTNEIQLQAPVTNEIQVQTPVTNEIQVQTPVTNEIKVQTPVTTEKQVQTPVSTEKQVQSIYLNAITSKISSLKQVQSIYLNAITSKISSLRLGFREINLAGAGSSIDLNYRFNSISELVKYFPRALQIGLLSPFPPDWFEKGQSTGKIGRLLAGMEMIIWYLILSGFIFVVFKDPSVLKPFATVFLFSITLIILYAYVIPNIGTVFRMRQAYMMPFFLFGAYGLSLMRSNFLKKQSN